MHTNKSNSSTELKIDIKPFGSSQGAFDLFSNIRLLFHIIILYIPSFAFNIYYSIY